MPTIKYTDINFRSATLDRIRQANEIIAEYQAQGFDLTLRQLYYQHVARGINPNNDREYKKLGDIVSDARLAGLMDWDAIVDRTRFVRSNNHWGSPEDIVRACASQFAIDKWARQPAYCEVWIEKDALAGVIDGICRRLDVPFFAARGYASVSEIWNAGRNRLKPRLRADKAVTIFYLGDHDPSGIDMTRDVQERLLLFADARGCDTLEVKRLALNMDQVEQYDPPENPTKMSDSRASGYVERYGEHCWELDALDPTVIANLIERAVFSVRDEMLWCEAMAEEAQHRVHLDAVSRAWDDVVEYAMQE